MATVYLARHPIYNKNGRVHGYELLFRGDDGNYTPITSNLMATSKVLLNSLTHMDFNQIVGKDKYVYVNVDHDVLLSGIIDMLKPERFIIELLETTELSDKMVSRIKKMHARGFLFALDDFDCKNETIKYYSPIFQYISYVKIDVRDASLKVARTLIPKFHKNDITVVAEKVETAEEYRSFIQHGYDLFQGYYFKQPELMEIEVAGESAKMTLLHMITMLRQEKEIDEIEQFVKTKPDVSYNLIKYLNSPAVGLKNEISSVNQAMNMLGRERLLRWLLVYLYSESAGGELSKMLLGVALGRAKDMEEQAEKEDKDKAFLVGMFSMLDVLFDTSFEVIFQGLPVEKAITDAIVYKKGRLGQDLKNAEKSEFAALKQVMIDNFHKFDVNEIIKMLSKVDVDIERFKADF